MSIQYRNTLGNLVPSRKGEIIAISQFPHPDDKYLFVVCIDTPDNYVVWMWNSEYDEYFWGDYTHKKQYEAESSALAHALIKFSQRLKTTSESCVPYEQVNYRNKN
jgi:hypothetical protein